MIEDLIINKLDELPSELINARRAHRPEQGGSIIHVEWDNEFKEANGAAQPIASCIEEPRSAARRYERH